MNKKTLISFLCVSSLGLFASQASATTYTGNIGFSTGSFSNGAGGEFTIYNTTLDVSAYDSTTTGVFQGSSPNSFQTFCIEKNEFLTQGEAIEFVTNSAANNGGIGGQTLPGFDPISRGAAYLYSEFAQGNLAGYDYTAGSGRVASATELQNAIWTLENEQSTAISSGLTNILTTKFGDITTAMLDQGTSQGSDYFGVYALNILDVNGNKLQDQLYFEGYSNIVAPTPDTGSALFLLGIALGGIGFFQKRFNK